MEIRQMIKLGLLGLTLFASPVAAQVLDSGPSDPNLFDTVISVPADPDIGADQSVGSDGLLTQINISDGGRLGADFSALSGSEVNINGGSVGEDFSVFSGGEVNISGGSVGERLILFPGVLNLFGSNFALDDVPLDSLAIDDTFTIVDRNVTLTGLLADGTEFSFNLNSGLNFTDDFFFPGSTVTVTLVSDAAETILGDVDQNGEVDFADIGAFVVVLQIGLFLPEADINQAGEVTFDDIPAFIEILTAG